MTAPDKTVIKLTLTEALELLAEAFDEPVANLSAEVSREQIVGWDSMGALMFSAELDERFGVELSADESRAMTTIGDALEFMRRHGVLAD